MNKSINDIEANKKELAKKTNEININNIAQSSYQKKDLKKNKLFSYRFFLCTIFINNINVYKQSYLSSYKFILIYKFVNQLLDISSYIFLHKENQIFKKILMRSKYKDFLENNKKININDDTFNMEMLESLKSQKLNILAEKKNNIFKKNMVNV